MSKPIDILLLSGEESGDKLAETLIADIQTHCPNQHIAGMGGQSLRPLGMDILVDNQDLSIIGLWGVIKHFKKIFSAWKTLKSAMIKHKPLVILIDYPGMNLRFAKLAKKHGGPVLYYVSPQIWAWKKGRIKAIKRYVDHMALLFDFEKQIYEKAGVPFTVVGHPLTHPHTKQTAERKNNTDQPHIVLCPGSRKAEIAAHLPILIQSAQRLQQHFPQATFTLMQARSVSEQQLASVPSTIHIAPQSMLDDIFQTADAALLVSGTITLQAAAHALPSIIIYKTNPLNYWIVKNILKIKQIGLSNIVCEQTLSPELIQANATAEKISQACIEQLNADNKTNEIRKIMDAMPVFSNKKLLKHVKNLLQKRKSLGSQ